MKIYKTSFSQYPRTFNLTGHNHLNTFSIDQEIEVVGGPNGRSDFY